MNLFEKIAYEYRKGNSALRQIMILNIAIFALSLLVNLFGFLSGGDGHDLLKYFYLPADLSTLVIRPWTLLTHVFFHSTSSLWHIGGNMLVIYFVGRVLEDFLSRDKFWTVFLGGGLMGGMFFVAFTNLFPVFEEQKHWLSLLGASGGVTAVVVAAGVHIPRYVVHLFGVWRIEMRWLAVLMVFLDLFTMPRSGNFGGLFAHLGGAFFGALYILELQGKVRFPSFNTTKRNRMRTVHRDESKRKIQKDRTSPEQEQIDAILDKISQSGYSSLTKEEKEILFRASK